MGGPCVELRFINIIYQGLQKVLFLEGSAIDSTNIVVASDDNNSRILKVDGGSTAGTYVFDPNYRELWVHTESDTSGCIIKINRMGGKSFYVNVYGTNESSISFSHSCTGVSAQSTAKLPAGLTYDHPSLTFTFSAVGCRGRYHFVQNPTSYNSNDWWVYKVADTAYTY